MRFNKRTPFLFSVNSSMIVDVILNMYFHQRNITSSNLDIHKLTTLNERVEIEYVGEAIWERGRETDGKRVKEKKYSNLV